VQKPRQQVHHVAPVSCSVDHALTASFAVAVSIWLSLLARGDGGGRALGSFVVVLAFVSVLGRGVESVSARIGVALDEALTCASRPLQLRATLVVAKWTSQCWQLCVHTVLALCAIVMLLRASWLTDTADVTSVWSDNAGVPTLCRLRADGEWARDDPLIVAYYYTQVRLLCVPHERCDRYTLYTLTHRWQCGCTLASRTVSVTNACAVKTMRSCLCTISPQSHCSR
jgi:hypothetical protein